LHVSYFCNVCPIKFLRWLYSRHLKREFKTRYFGLGISIRAFSLQNTYRPHFHQNTTRIILKKFRQKNMYKCPNGTIYSLVGDTNEIVDHRYNSWHTYNIGNNNSGTTTHTTTSNLGKKIKLHFFFFSFYRCSSFSHKTGRIAAKFIFQLADGPRSHMHYMVAIRYSLI
jgi:hypothetical protein